jgi:limonene-1,2-epoxide hydrolase
MRGPLETIDAFVAAFVAAWPTGEAGALADFFTEEVVYRNGPLEPVAGRTAVLAALEAFMEVGGRVSVDMLHVVTEGELVMTERVDYLEVDGRSVALPVAGVFELAGPRIKAWRDYFDLAQFASHLDPGG